MARPAILIPPRLETLPVCGVQWLCSIVDICHRDAVFGTECAQIFLLRRTSSRTGDGAGLLQRHENIQDIFVQDCRNFLRLLQCGPAQQIKPEHGAAQHGNCLVVLLYKDLRFAVLRIPNHKTAIAALSFFLRHAMQYRPLLHWIMCEQAAVCGQRVECKRRLAPLSFRKDLRSLFLEDHFEHSQNSSLTGSAMNTAERTTSLS